MTALLPAAGASASVLTRRLSRTGMRRLRDPVSAAASPREKKPGQMAGSTVFPQASRELPGSFARQILCGKKILFVSIATGFPKKLPATEKTRPATVPIMMLWKASTWNPVAIAAV